MDEDEEAYYNASDDEDDLPTGAPTAENDENAPPATAPNDGPQKVRILNGSPPASSSPVAQRPLVDYPEDEDEEAQASTADAPPTPPSPALSNASIASSTGPPKRKLRDEDDEDAEDALDKLAKAQRKDSPGQVRKKRSFIGGARTGSPGAGSPGATAGQGKKIAISLTGLGKRKEGSISPGSPMSPASSDGGGGSKRKRGSQEPEEAPTLTSKDHETDDAMDIEEEQEKKKRKPSEETEARDEVEKQLEAEAEAGKGEKTSAEKDGTVELSSEDEVGKGKEYATASSPSSAALEAGVQSKLSLDSTASSTKSVKDGDEAPTAS